MAVQELSVASPENASPTSELAFKAIGAALTLAEQMVYEAEGTPFETKANGVYDALENANLRMAALKLRIKRSARAAAKSSAKAASAKAEREHVATTPTAPTAKK